ncbi:MAG TPA: carboxypeptidase-like regulatory domain-containing protein [Candidatus Dormibacteraeota bacterium]|nr:carboxypeptidase-like regulatory domain-containing protein [Candidatus Dormibacteraeota bacterium]
MKRLLLPALALALCACGVGGNPTGNETPATGTISGSAIWSNIDCGVYSFACPTAPPVTIQVKNSAGQPVTSWHGTEGPFQFAGLQPGSYSVEAVTDAPGDAAGALTSIQVQAGTITPNVNIPLQPPSAICLATYQGHDATVSFNGPGGDDWCRKLIQIDGNWFVTTATAPASGLSTVCSGTSRAGVAWTVYDSGGEFYGHQVCAQLNQLSAA